MATESPKVEYGIGLPQAMAERGELLENLIDTSADLVAQEASTETARRWAVHLEQELAEARRLLAALMDSLEPDSTAQQCSRAIGEVRDYLGRPDVTRVRPGTEVAR